MPEGFEIIIGLEVHAQLATKSKIFCGCSTEFGAEPNVHTCPVCLGMPGVLPVLNKKAVEYAVKAGLALNCEIASFSKFDRKNYFYPDLPKAYQISQYDLPLCKNGYIDVEDDNGETFRVRINRIHLEEDAGKLVHGTGANITESDAALVDLNRAGVPLIEIVTEPDIHSPAQARAYLITLKSILKYLGVSDCNMEEGSLRVDANVSIRPVGSKEFGTKTELKNMNSFKALERALEYEVERQAEVIKSGGKVVQETRTWDEKAGKTVSMRSKEEAHDYRYFPEPDLVPIKLDREWIEEIRASIGELPKEKKQRFIEQYGLPEYDAGVLTQDKALADFFEDAAKEYHDPKAVSNWVMGDFLRLVKEENIDYGDLKITGSQLAEMLKLIDKGTISSKIAKTVFEEMFKTGKNPKTIVEEKGLIQISDESVLEGIVQKVLDANPQAIADYKAGKDRAIKFLMGQVMKETRGKANPQLVNKILMEKLNA
ncbi:aspartyl/glutamyl-tRNA amidotransferase subunit B [Anoxybacter fermentans]|uniref:Aspartyl/glutamyl-tRNA(Asn/Gln) amidotransferase subunit B n=1 Tax=Anoxybacter fermentans TaxID=1323375 RepID=A0A3S9SUW1_9FIRM|nr:Asp-tRNA(Asn)/Glu-tRNA(Gln) amidotransferase subunit GatB [Anoxybacter fermentans]AZR72068.1 aspartyl/glutamyl-tRNA amidotransferase subunit B [Anoxybacter fermentans]